MYVMKSQQVQLFKQQLGGSRHLIIREVAGYFNINEGSVVRPKRWDSEIPFVH